MVMASLLLFWLLSCPVGPVLARNVEGGECIKPHQDCQPGTSRCCNQEQQCSLKASAKNDRDGSCIELTLTSSLTVRSSENSIATPPKACLSVGKQAVTPHGWLDYGCHFDLGHSGLDLSSFSATNDNHKCAKICARYQYFGTMNGTTCLCGNSMASVEASDGGCCDLVCPGASTSYKDICGGSTSISLWKVLIWSSPISETPTSTPPAASSLLSSIISPPSLIPSHSGIPQIPGWIYFDCLVAARIPVDLLRTIGMPGNATNAACAELCFAYRYFGTERGFLCHCGNTLDTVFMRMSTECTVQCLGNVGSREYCGGERAISVFHRGSAETGS